MKSTNAVLLSLLLGCSSAAPTVNPSVKPSPPLEIAPQPYSFPIPRVPPKQRTLEEYVPRKCPVIWEGSVPSELPTKISWLEDLPEYVITQARSFPEQQLVVIYAPDVHTVEHFKKMRALLESAQAHDTLIGLEGLEGKIDAERKKELLDTLEKAQRAATERATHYKPLLELIPEIESILAFDAPPQVFAPGIGYLDTLGKTLPPTVYGLDSQERYARALFLNVYFDFETVLKRLEETYFSEKNLPLAKPLYHEIAGRKKFLETLGYHSTSLGYDFSLGRERSFHAIEAMEHWLITEGKDVGVIIYGSLHKEEILCALAMKSISYAVVKPVTKGKNIALSEIPKDQ